MGPAFTALTTLDNLFRMLADRSFLSCAHSVRYSDNLSVHTSCTSLYLSMLHGHLTCLHRCAPACWVQPQKRHSNPPPAFDCVNITHDTKVLQACDTLNIPWNNYWTQLSRPVNEAWGDRTLDLNGRVACIHAHIMSIQSAVRASPCLEHDQSSSPHTILHTFRRSWRSRHRILVSKTRWLLYSSHCGLQLHPSFFCRHSTVSRPEWAACCLVGMRELLVLHQKVAT